MTHKKLNRFVSLLLVMVTLIGMLALPASAASIVNSKTATIKYLGRTEILKKTGGSSMGASSWTYTTNDGLTGAAYCVNWGLSMVSASKALTLQPYNRSPKTMGAFANAYPMRSLEQFKTLHTGDVRGVANLTEEEYKYASQVAIWASCGQIAVPGTAFTAGRSSLIEPTSDAKQIRVFDSIKAILALANGWTRHLYVGMYLRGELDKDIRTVEIVNDQGLAGAAANNEDGIKKETINGKEYYTRTMYVASATSTWIDGYTTKVYSTDAPTGTIFTAADGSALTTTTENGVTYYKVDTHTHRNTGLNANGSEYYGAFKVCIPAEAAADSGSFQIKSVGGVAQFNLYLAYNPTATEQSYIIADPGYTTANATGTIKWGSVQDQQTADVQITKVDGTGNPLEGAEFRLSGSKGTTLTGTTDRNGQITWLGVDASETFTLTETKAPEGYTLVQPMSISVSAGRTAYITVRDNTEATLQVKKVDAQNKGSLQGAVFLFEQIDGSYKTTGITGFDGIIEFVGDDLPYGSYRITEQSAPEGYLQDTSVQTVNWDGEKDVILTFENVRKPTLTIVKVDEQTGVALPGAAFDVYADGQKITSVTTNDAGEAYVTGINMESYIEVVETAAPAGYVLDSTRHGIHIDPYNPATQADPMLTVTNRAMPALRIVKYDAQTKQPLPDTKFEVYRDTQLIGEYTTNESGEIFLYDLAPGTYLVKEVATVSTHVVNSTPQQIELEGGATSTYNLVFLNYIKPGIHMTKLDSQTMQPLANAKFRISEVGGGFSKEFITDANGEIDLTSLNPGSYVVEELAAPNGYLIDNAQRIIKIEGGENAEFVFTDTQKPSMVIVKYDSEGKKLLSGATFRIAKIEDGSHYLDRITDTNGKITLTDLEPGVYSVKEMSAPSGYVLNENEYHVELFPGQTSQLVVNNDKKPDLQIIKTDAVSGKPVQGVTFTLKKSDGSTITTEATDAKGEVLIRELDPGVYEVWEQSVPDEYLIDENHQHITLFPNRTGTVRFQNYPKPSLTVNKVDSVTGDPIKGAKFHVYYASNNTFSGEINDLGTYYSDENGQFKLYKLTDGWFKVTEVEPAPGYAIKEPATQECFIKAGTDKTLTFENVPLSALVIYKYDSVSGKAVEGAVFQIKYLNGTSGTGGTVIGTYKTSANGSFTVTGLKAGTYIAEELASDNDHVIDTAPQTAYLSGKAQDVVQLYFGNSPKGALMVKKVDSVTGKPLSGVEFFVTTSSGTVVGDANGKFYTDSAGSFTVSGIDPNTTLVVKETRAKDGYVLDDTPQTAKIKAGQTVTLEFRNAPKGSLIIRKIDSVTKQPLSGAEFKVIKSDGSFIPTEGGQISSNGIYTTDENGEIHITLLDPSTIVVTETKAPDGYLLDTTPQTVVVNSNDTQTLTFTNTPIGGLIITKSDENSGKRLSGVQFEVRKMNGEIVGTYTTDRNGVIQLPQLSKGWYTVTELKTISGYLLDSTPQHIEVKDGQTATLALTNRKASDILLHKVDSATGKGIYGATFLLYDSNHNPIGQYTSDQDGYVYMDEGLEDGRYYIREIKAADGYILDNELKTIYVQYGATSEIRWENTAVRGQIQIVKKSADDNPINGLPAGSLLEGAVFEIYDKAGNKVDTVRTDRNGRAVSKLLPLSRYTIREVSAPAYYSVNPTVMTAYLEHESQIVTFEVLDSSVSTGVSIEKHGPKEVMPGQPIRYTLKDIANTSTVPLSSFYWRDTLPGQVTLSSVVTGTYNQQLSYKVVYKTNLSGSTYRTLADNLSTSRNYVLDVRPATLRLAANERITEVMFVFGQVKAGFAQVDTPAISGTVMNGLSNSTSLVNVADVGGLYNGQWIQAVSRVLTTVYAKTTVTLPKTGY